MGIDLHILTLIHYDIVQPNDSIHRCPYLMRHVGKEFAFRNAGFLCLTTHLLNLSNIGLYIRHIQDQNDTSLYFSVFIYNMFAMAFILMPIEGKTVWCLLNKHLLTEILHHPDIFPQLMCRQTVENIRCRPVITHQTVMVIQRNNSVTYAFQDFLRCQMAEIIITAAPDHDEP